MQHALYRAAKADPNRRFHALFDKGCRRDVLGRVWQEVRRNRGADGIDRVTLVEVEEYGVARLLDELAVELRDKRYRPLPARRVFIPKLGTGEQRPLSIHSVRDRIVQAAAKIVLEPIFEAGMADCSFGFRPGRSPHDALQVLIDESWQGRRWVVETDIADCFEALGHSGLMQAIEERVCDRAVLSLVRAMLRAGVMDGGSLRRSATGAPQGGVISPLLCNVYLHRLDRAWSTGQHGVPVRFVDDAVVMCRTRQQAEAALERLTGLLAGLGLEPKAAKTCIVHLAEGEEEPLFMCCHPALSPPDLQIALTLRFGRRPDHRGDRPRVLRPEEDDGPADQPGHPRGGRDRLHAGVRVGVQEPDRRSRIAALLRRASARRLRPADDVISYTLPKLA